MKKALLVATIGFFFPQFEMPDIRLLQELGYEVHLAANFQVPISSKRRKQLDESGCILHQIDFIRSPWNIIQNIKCCQQMEKLIRREGYQLLHCHTPMGGAISRIAAHRAGLKNVVYTAHGFHFYKGAPFLNWVIYYPAERFLSLYTDTQITINQEDYRKAHEGFYCLHVDYIPGVGIEIPEEKQLRVEKNEVRTKIRDDLGIRENELMFLSVGELIARKNHGMVMRNLRILKEKGVPFQYYICGIGKNMEKYKRLISKEGLSDNIHLLGYRDDISELNASADLFIFPSLQEGLPLALMEAISVKTPAIVSAVRGNKDLIQDPEYLFDPRDDMGFQSCLLRAVNAIRLGKIQNVAEENYARLESFSMERVRDQMQKIYQRYDSVAPEIS